MQACSVLHPKFHSQSNRLGVWLWRHTCQYHCPPVHCRTTSSLFPRLWHTNPIPQWPSLLVQSSPVPRRSSANLMDRRHICLGGSRERLWHLPWHCWADRAVTRDSKERRSDTAGSHSRECTVWWSGWFCSDKECWASNSCKHYMYLMCAPKKIRHEMHHFC